MKKEIRVLGIDDSPFLKTDKDKKLVVGTVFRGGSWLDGLLSCKVTVDGEDATDSLIEMVNKSRFKKQLQCIFTDGIAVAGFNVLDISRIQKRTGIPVIAVMRRHPDLERMKNALRSLGQEKKIALLEKAGKIRRSGNLYIQKKGLSLGEAHGLLRLVCTRSHLPEPIRAAHIIATGIVKGESKGNA